MEYSRMGESGRVSARRFAAIRQRLRLKRGCVRTRSRSPGLLATTVALAVAVLGVGTASADTVFSDGFESGDFSAWSQLQVGGDGTAVVQSTIVRTGSLAAQLSESSTSGSFAYARKTVSAVQQDLTASGDFQVLQQGASGGNVPFFRLLDPSSARIVSVYRQNGSSGTAGVSTVQIGNDTAAQAFALVADTIDVQNGASPVPSPPVNTQSPSISGT